MHIGQPWPPGIRLIAEDEQVGMATGIGSFLRVLPLKLAKKKVMLVE